MARELWILRHADAEPHGVRTDAERKLTAKGESQAVAAGRAIARIGVEFELILTSPKVRAEQTAKLALAQWRERQHHRAGGLVVHQPLAGSFDGGQALDAIAGLSSRGRALVVGHEPDLSGIVEELTGARIDLKKGGLAVVRLPSGGCGELLLLVAPRHLALVAFGS